MSFDGIVGFSQLQQFDVHLIRKLPFIAATLSFRKGPFFLLNEYAFDLFSFFTIC